VENQIVSYAGDMHESVFLAEWASAARLLLTMRTMQILRPRVFKASEGEEGVNNRKRKRKEKRERSNNLF